MDQQSRLQPLQQTHQQLSTQNQQLLKRKEQLQEQIAKAKRKQQRQRDKDEDDHNSDDSIDSEDKKVRDEQEALKKDLVRERAHLMTRIEKASKALERYRQEGVRLSQRLVDVPTTTTTTTTTTNQEVALAARRIRLMERVSQHQRHQEKLRDEILRLRNPIVCSSTSSTSSSRRGSEMSSITTFSVP